MSRSDLKTEGYKRRVASAFAVVTAIALVVLFLNVIGVTSALTRYLVENRFSLLERQPTGDIVVVDIDAKSLSDVGVWPWPRSLYGDLVDKLVADGASQIAFDIDFSTKSTDQEDAAFAAAMERAGGIVSLAMFAQQSGQASNGASGFTVNRPIDLFADLAWPAIVSVPIEADNKVWRSLWGDVIDASPELSLPALLADKSGNVSEAFWIDYGIDPKQVPITSFVNVLNGTFKKGTFDGKKVVVGASAQELRDLFPVPVHGILPGSLVEVLGAESILQGRALSARGADLLLVLVLALAFPMVLFVKSNWKLRLTMLVLLGGGIEAAAVAVQSRFPLILETGPAETALILVGLHLVLKQIGFHQFLLQISRAQTQNSRRLLGQVFEDSFDAIIVIDAKGNIVAASRKAVEMFDAGLAPGASASEVLPVGMIRDAMNILSDDGLDEHKPVLKTLGIGSGAEDQRIIEYVVTVSSHLDVSSRGVDDQSAVHLACLTCRDVTEKRRAAERLAYLAKYEPLTGLLNRSSFLDAVATEFRFGLSWRQPRIMLVFSVINMERIAASLGFSYADKLRQAIADRLTAFLELADLATALSDDKFACFARLDDLDTAPAHFAERLRDVMSAEYEIDGNRVIVSVNAGYVVTDGESNDAKMLLRQAANALSRVQTSMAAHIVCFDKDMENQVDRRQQLELDLAKAVEREDLQIVYQPQVDLKTGDLIGVEALLRWKHKDLGMVSPIEFIGIAEESGRIVELGAWVMEEAMCQAAKWSRSLSLAVNVSAIQLIRGDLPAMVSRALERTSFPAHQLDLEITESLFIDENLDLKEPISQLRALGCSWSLDDFGTGYSGLGYIPRFPFSKIKIDRSFVMNIEKDKGHIAIVKAVVDMAEAFGMAVLAEGVETAEQRNVLRDLGCTIGQGYYFSRPVPAAEIEKMLKLAA